ncbi:MAG: MBL fold metallo-hydrolase [Armatimonadota bacterium]
MEITFLGTSADDAYPLTFCRCSNCEQARELGGPSLRRRSSALIGDDLLIDLGPDIATGAFLSDRSLAGVRYCLQTHAHADHLDPAHLLARGREYGILGDTKLHFYGSAATVARMASHFQGFYDSANLLDPKVCERLNLEIHQIEAFQPLAVGPYRVVPFPASHDPSVDPLLYAIQGDGRTIFYGTDTALLSEDTLQAIHQLGLVFDVIILDHTYGPGVTGTDHLSAEQFVEQVARMRHYDLIADFARIFATHISHEGNPPHPQLVHLAAKSGYEIAFDGQTI